MPDERDHPKEPETAADDGTPDEEELKELPEAGNADIQRMNDHVREIRRTFISSADRQNLAYGGGDAIGGHQIGRDLNIFMAGGERDPLPTSPSHRTGPTSSGGSPAPPARND
ncbi:hypothetical protein Acsp03_03580 [Actinomadura sp. NBRC 104412]|uniref:hypothetical protein n=1 Tax=Actinomadura sp. NBRC 104412 TaxID=3032203 RepID=UPI0024A5B33B|nr:hypothetical protein [Actinomadura sp. NBRC 104412]GLZ02891.1 hypothetical protein Acsp03_03580 [Actinomadura sp. NBRC 104412]